MTTNEAGFRRDEFKAQCAAAGKIADVTWGVLTAFGRFEKIVPCPNTYPPRAICAAARSCRTTCTGSASATLSAGGRAIGVVMRP